MLTHNISVHGSVPTCTLRFLAVGGGGKGQGSASKSCSGGGSGYLQYRSISVSSGTKISAEVGDYGEPSTVVINGRSTVANPGGRDGYSGGGYGGYNGGTDGGDGECKSHNRCPFEGKGTGDDITAFYFSSWNLTPGRGGLVNRASSYTCTCKVCGGGGGGVAVDGTQPTYYNGADYITLGYGYGGGGSGYYRYRHSIMTYGRQGIILLEITSG